tara:strand:+ start:1264 stop:2346 length:1083 start_codon:yes stop_codon:yes gene_type:complete
MTISYRFIGLLVLSIGTCFIFFNPLNLNNEIFPYYLLSIFFVPLKIKDYLLSILLIVAAVFWFLNFPSFRIFIDPIMILSTIFAFRFFSELDEEEKNFFFNFIKFFIFANTIICIIQTYSDYFQTITYFFFSGREDGVSVKLLDRGVTGLSPEPAYGSALIIGLALLYSAYVKPSLIFFTSVSLTIYLQSSISGLAYFFLYFAFTYLLHYRYDINRLSLRNLSIIYTSIFLIIIFYLYQIDFSQLIQNIRRLLDFLTFIIQEENILMAEEQTGSVRLILIFLSFADLIHYDYGPGFSFFGYLNRIFATPLISFIILFYLFRTYKISMSYLIAVMFGFLAGPVLIWPLYFLTFYGLPKKIG